MQFFLNDLLGTAEFSGLGTLDETFQQLRKNYVDTFNITSLEKLAARFIRKKKVNMLIQKYKEVMEKFLAETVVTEFHAALKRMGPVQPRESQDQAVIKIAVPESSANKRTLKDMKSLAGRAFGVYHQSFVSLHVVPGSIFITWFFPKTFTKELAQLGRTKSDLFIQKGVKEVEVEGEVVFPQRKVGNRQHLHSVIQ